jgi:hypothetical protein
MIPIVERELIRNWTASQGDERNSAQRLGQSSVPSMN